MTKLRPTTLRLHTFPADAAILQTPCTPVLVIDDAFMDAVTEMENLTYRHNGFAIAAPQVGISQRFFVFRKYYAEQFGFASHLIINPEIIAVEGTRRMEESCLSLPELLGWLDRPEFVTLRYATIAAPNRKVDWEYRCGGIAARVVQHEMDHLSGKLFHNQLDKTYDEKVARYFAKKAAT